MNKKRKRNYIFLNDNRIPPDIVRIGEKDLSNTDAPPQDFGIALIIGHPEYRPRELYNDIALIKLSKRATITSKVRPACLWQGNAFNFTDVTATGYGHTEFGGKSSNELLKVDLTIFNNDECTLGYQNERLLKDGIVESQLCAGDSAGEKDTCQVKNLPLSTKDNNFANPNIVFCASYRAIRVVRSRFLLRTEESRFFMWLELRRSAKLAQLHYQLYTQGCHTS